MRRTLSLLPILLFLGKNSDCGRAVELHAERKENRENAQTPYSSGSSYSCSLTPSPPAGDAIGVPGGVDRSGQNQPLLAGLRMMPSFDLELLLQHLPHAASQCCSSGDSRAGPHRFVWIVLKRTTVSLERETSVINHFSGSTSGSFFSVICGRCGAISAFSSMNRDAPVRRRA